MQSRQTTQKLGWRVGTVVRDWVLAGGLMIFLASCATSTVESRKQERMTSYLSLTPEQKRLVDAGQIRVGLNADAVYIAWGPPGEVVESESDQGHITTWIYHGQTMEETRYWTFREVPRDGTVFLERHLESDYSPRSYVRAEIQFVEGQVKAWRTLPKPPGR